MPFRAWTISLLPAGHYFKKIASPKLCTDVCDGILIKCRTLISWVLSGLVIFILCLSEASYNLLLDMLLKMLLGCGNILGVDLTLFSCESAKEHVQYFLWLEGEAFKVLLLHLEYPLRKVTMLEILAELAKIKSLTDCFFPLLD